MSAFTGDSFGNPHGSKGKYDGGCRCEPCRTASTEAARERRAKLWVLATPEHVHGSENGYTNYRCRCTDCKAAHAARRRREKAEGRALFEQYRTTKS